MIFSRNVFVSALLILSFQSQANPALVGSSIQEAAHCRAQHNSANMTAEDRKYWADRCNKEAYAKAPSFTSPPKTQVAQSLSELASLQMTCNMKAFQQSKEFMRRCAKNGIVPESEKKKWEWHKEVVCEAGDKNKCRTVYSN